MLTRIEPEDILNDWEIYCGPKFNYSDYEAAEAVAEDYEMDLDDVIEILHNFGIDIIEEL